MLALFDTIFRKRHHTAERFPEALVKRAIERAVDSTDGRVRILPGYARQLLQAPPLDIPGVTAPAGKPNTNVLIRELPRAIFLPYISLFDCF